MRNISPSEMTDFTFCSKYWYLKRHKELVPRKIGIRHIAAMMGQAVGWMAEQHYTNKTKDWPMSGAGYFRQLLEHELNLGREYDWGVEKYLDDHNIDALVLEHFENLVKHQDLWLKGGEVIAVEPVMKEWGQARQDITIRDPLGHGVVGDFKCKLKADSDKFPISRDIDLYGNQAELYPLAWDSTGHECKIKVMRFIYQQKDRLPIVEDRIVNPKRQAQWIKVYENVVEQIAKLEAHPERMHDELTENPYHMTPWGYACEFRKYCSEGEHEQAGWNEFIQIERRAK